MQIFKTFIGPEPLLAYLCMMAPRLREFRRVMRPTASLYLHCDTTASHYLKILLDATFGAENFLNDIIWKRHSAHNNALRCGAIHDSLLLYKKGGEHTWNSQYHQYSQDYLESFYRYTDPDGRRYRLGDLTARGTQEEFEWKGVRRKWAQSREKMAELEAQGRILYSSSGLASYKRYLDEGKGVPLQDLWLDINPISAHSKERGGYATQKPRALLNRIIQASSNPGDVVLDPFLGWGTTIFEAHALKRRWIGIDISHLSTDQVKESLQRSFGCSPGTDYMMRGEPVDLEGARALASDDRNLFEHWALGLVGARDSCKGKGKDRGIDGKLIWISEKDGSSKTMPISVKSGKVSSLCVRELSGTMNREKAELGLLITLEEPTDEMRREALSDLYEVGGVGVGSTIMNSSPIPRIQILTVEDLLKGKQVRLPLGLASKTYGPATHRQNSHGEDYKPRGKDQMNAPDPTMNVIDFLQNRTESVP